MENLDTKIDEALSQFKNSNQSNYKTKLNKLVNILIKNKRYIEAEYFFMKNKEKDLKDFKISKNGYLLGIYLFKFEYIKKYDAIIFNFKDKYNELLKLRLMYYISINAEDNIREISSEIIKAKNLKDTEAIDLLLYSCITYKIKDLAHYLKYLELNLSKQATQKLEEILINDSLQNTFPS